MLFNSLDFSLFLPIVFILYWFVFNRNLRLQNAFILLTSYVFYGWWDVKFLSLIIFSTLVDFSVAKAMENKKWENKRKILLYISLLANLGILGFFKYYNFFIDSWVSAWSEVGISMNASTLNIVLPVGISFYTFQTLSYTIDVYRKKLEPTNNLIEFGAYVAFFPQLVAGPIERATRLLPQFKVTRVFSYKLAISGFYLIVWGLFKKMVVADNCAFFVNKIFENPDSFSSLELFLGSVLFGIQIYGDFSGYSDIAIGVARLFGFDLMTNFKFPYFSRDIAEFWRRWHISLSTWFRDYVYIPLGGSNNSVLKTLRNVLIVFLVSGFWHGANWTFMAWGALHALLFVPLLLSKRHRNYIGTTHMRMSQLFGILLTFFLVSIAWIYFRSDSISIAHQYFYRMFSLNGMDLSIFYNSSKTLLFTLIIAFSVLVMFIFEYIVAQKNRVEVQLNMVSSVFIMLLILFMGVFKNPAEFIYFQF